MEKVKPYRREITSLLGVRLFSEPDTSAEKIAKLPYGTVVWVYEEDLNQNDGYLWAHVGIGYEENPFLDKNLIGYIPLFEVRPLTKRLSM